MVPNIEIVVDIALFRGTLETWFAAVVLAKLVHGHHPRAGPGYFSARATAPTPHHARGEQKRYQHGRRAASCGMRIAHHEKQAAKRGVDRNRHLGGQILRRLSDNTMINTHCYYHYDVWVKRVGEGANCDNALYYFNCVVKHGIV